MSSRGPIGASNRAELFSSRDQPPVSPTRATPRESARMGEFVGGGAAGDFSPDARAREMKQAYGLESSDANSEDYDDPLQLEHILGYSGDYRKTILCVPGDENLYVKRYQTRKLQQFHVCVILKCSNIFFLLHCKMNCSMGCLASIESLADPQSQRILRGHDNQVSAMAISPSGRNVATGQNGTKNFKGSAAPVFLWDTASSRRTLVLRGLTVCVNILAFSTGRMKMYQSRNHFTSKIDP